MTTGIYPMLNDYKDIVGKAAIKNIMRSAKPLTGKHITHINSTYYGGGVAEMLNRLVPIFNSMGIDMGWRAIKGNPDFFSITKKFHNSLQGDPINLTRIKKKIYEEVNETNALFTHIDDNDCIIVHDPQPLPLIASYDKKQPWVWRCHVDLSTPYSELWEYFEKYIRNYDMMVISKKDFRHDSNIPVSIIHPSIDPLSPKNKDLSASIIKKYLRKFRIPTDKPIISQISRFDKWKDPKGVIAAYRIIKKKIDCRLVLLGSMASDDPEGNIVLDELKENAEDDPDIIIINFENDILVNALQRASEIVIQKSLKEGFGLTVSEALWKETPVVASDVGGIPLQVIDGENGFLIHSIESCADACIKLLKDKKMRDRFGRAGKKHIRKNYLITRHIQDYIELIKGLIINYKT